MNFNKWLWVIIASLTFITAIYIIAPIIAIAADAGIKGILYITYLYAGFRYCEYTINCIKKDIQRKIKEKLDDKITN